MIKIQYTVKWKTVSHRMSLREMEDFLTRRKMHYTAREIITGTTIYSETGDAIGEISVIIDGVITDD